MMKVYPLGAPEGGHRRSQDEQLPALEVVTEAADVPGSDVPARDATPVGRGFVEVALGLSGAKRVSEKLLKSSSLPTDSSRNLAGIGNLIDGDAHWAVDGPKFREVEALKRLENVKYAASKSLDNSSSHTSLFFSHCWRNVVTQRRKRKLYAAMTESPHHLVFWADFLDLQAQGPIPWRSEIGQAIQACSKFVAMVDKDYLCSFNCLEELCYAIKYHKPLVLAILDQTAWNLLAGIGGHLEVWEKQWGAEGMHLGDHVGQPFGPDATPFSCAEVQRIFSVLSAINFCPCRDLDCVNMGEANVAERLCSFVNKDLEYTKEHAFLQARAESWEAADRANSLLLERKADVEKWGSWAGIAKLVNAFPPPTDLQSSYVAASQKLYARKSKALKAAGIIMMGVIIALMVASVVLAVKAVQQTRRATKEAEIANLHRLDAVREKRVAAALLLSSDTNPIVTSENRAMLRGVEIANYIGYPFLAAPAMQLTLSYLMELSHWFFDIRGHSDRVWAVSFSPDGLHAASASEDHTIRITPLPRRDVGGIEVLPKFEPGVALRCPGPVLSLSWSPSGDLIAAGCASNPYDLESLPFVRVWWHDRSSDCWQVLSDLPGGDIPAQTRAMAWSPNSAVLATGDESGFSTLWKIGPMVESREEPERLAMYYTVPNIMGPENSRRIRAVAWTSEAPLMAIAGTDDTTYLIDTRGYDAAGEDGHPTLIAWSQAHRNDVNALGFSHDGGRLASGSDDTSVFIFDVTGLPADNGPAAELTVLHTLPKHGDQVTGLAWSSNGELATCSDDSTVRVYRFSGYGTPTESWTLAHEMVNPERGFSSVQFAPGRPDLMILGSRSNNIRAYQLATGFGDNGPRAFKMNCTQEVLDKFNAKFDIRGSTFSYDGSRFAASSYRGHVCIWERDQAGDFVVVATLNFTHLSYEKSPATRVIKFSPSGDMLVAGEDKTGIHAWYRASDEDGNASWRWFGSLYFTARIRDVEWSPDGHLVAAASDDGYIGIWDMQANSTELQVFSPEIRARILAVAWRDEPVGGCHVLASGGSDRKVHIWQVCPSGEVSLAAVIPDYKAQVRSLSWKNGKLASSTEDATLLIHAYRADGSLELLYNLEGQRGEIWGISWAPDGRQLATASNDNTVRVWALNRTLEGSHLNYTSWRVEWTCRYIQWLVSSPARLACGRASKEPGGAKTINLPVDPYSYYVEYSLVDYVHSMQLLEGLTYGDLQDVDLFDLGYQSISGIAMDPEMLAELGKAGAERSEVGQDDAECLEVGTEEAGVPSR